MTISEIMEKFPVEYKEHIADQYHHRFSRGESYHDLVIRLESIILELEREKNDILIIADASVLRCIYAFFANIPGNVFSILTQRIFLNLSLRIMKLGK